MHLKSHKPVITLNLSKRRAAAQCIVPLKKSQLNKRLSKCRIGISEGRTQRGKCDTCTRWKQGAHRWLRALVDDKYMLLDNLWPGYFAAWYDKVKEELLDERELDGCSNPAFVQGLIDFLEEQNVLTQDFRDARLSEAEQVRLAGEEQEFVEGLKDKMEGVLNISWHWALKNSCDALFRECWYKPEPGVLFGLWDHTVV